MGFVRTESWIETRPHRSSDMLDHLFDHRWLRNGIAFTISLVLDAGLILALVSLGRNAVPPASPSDRSIPTFDIASLSAQQEGAAATTAPMPASPPSPPQAIPTPAPPREWSTVALPPLSPPVTAAALSPPAVAAPAQGLASAGSGSGAGYDPYAFASYQKPDPARLGLARTLQPLPDATARLLAALGLKSNQAGHAIDLRVYVDPAGRVTRAELASTAPPGVAERLARLAPGIPVCAADPARPPDASLVVTLTV